MGIRGRPIAIFFISACLLTLAAVTASAQTASALLREGDPLPGATGETVVSLNSPVVNHAFGYAVTVNSTGSGTTLSHIWGHATGGDGTVILSEGTYGDYQQTSFESFHGLSDAGDPAYSASSNSLVTGTTGLDGAWLYTTPLLVEEEPVPTLAGQFSTFNSRPGITADGHPYWVGGISTVQGGSSQNRVLFYGTAATPVLMGGDSIGGVPEPVDTSSSNIDFDYRFSALGTFYLAPVLVDASSTIDGVMVLNGNALMAGGSIVREASPIPASIGGLAGENWDNFDFVGITEDMEYLVTGDTDATSSQDEFVMVSGEIVLREGDLLETGEGMLPISGSIEGGYMNAEGDWAVIWDVDDATGNVEALLLNGALLLKEGDPVDLDGDGIEEPGSILANFTGISALVLGDRDDAGMVDIYFTADIDTLGTSTSSDDTEGVFRLTAQASEVEVLQLPLDIKPGGCPNSHNPVSNGVLPTAIAGTMEFDVATIDVASLQISRADGVGGSIAPSAGPPGPSTVLEDVTTPYIAEETCDCVETYGDGFYDLSMKYPSEGLREVLDLDHVAAGEFVELVVTGLLLDGTPFRASDCVRIVGGGRPVVTSAMGGSTESDPMHFGSGQPDRNTGANPVPQGSGGAVAPTPDPRSRERDRRFRARQERTR